MKLCKKLCTLKRFEYFCMFYSTGHTGPQRGTL